MPRVSRYAFVNAKLRARISRMIPREWFMNVAGAPSLSEAVAMLDGTQYAAASKVYRETGDLKLMEVEILRVERDDVGAVRRFVEAQTAELTAALFEKYTSDIVKNAIRVWFARVVSGRGTEEVVAYLVRDTRGDGFSVDEIVNASDGAALVRALSDTPYASIVEEQIDDVIERGSLFPLELAVDRWYFDQLKRAVSKLDRQDAMIAHRLLGIRVDLMNLQWITRVRQFYSMEESEVMDALIPGGVGFNLKSIQSIYRSDSPIGAITETLAARYGDTGVPQGETDDLRRLTLLSFMLQEILMHEIRRVLGGYPFTIGIVLAYVFLRQNEARMIRTVLNARAYDLDPEVVGGLL